MLHLIGSSLKLISGPIIRFIMNCKKINYYNNKVYRHKFHLTICNTNLKPRDFTNIFENMFGKNCINKIQTEQIYTQLQLGKKIMNDFYTFNKDFSKSKQRFMYISLNLQNINKNGINILKNIRNLNDNYMFYTYNGIEGIFRYNVIPNIDLYLCNTTI
tara:strand:- start:4007 stop:4483 length:477 start_codon:yes stop_codon:yes gene_type:complete